MQRHGHPLDTLPWYISTPPILLKLLKPFEDSSFIFFSSQVTWATLYFTAFCASCYLPAWEPTMAPWWLRHKVWIWIFTPGNSPSDRVLPSDPRSHPRPACSIHQEDGFLSPTPWTSTLPPAIPPHPSIDPCLRGLPHSSHILPPASSAPGPIFFSPTAIICHPGVFKWFPVKLISQLDWRLVGQRSRFIFKWRLTTEFT